MLKTKLAVLLATGLMASCVDAQNTVEANIKKALEPQLTADVLYRPKMVYSVPMARWFRGPLKQRVRDAVLGERLASTGWFDRSCLAHLVDSHQSGVADHSAALGSLLMFEEFLRNVVDEGAPAPAAEWPEAEVPA